MIPEQPKSKAEELPSVGVHRCSSVFCRLHKQSISAIMWRYSISMIHQEVGVPFSLAENGNIGWIVFAPGDDRENARHEREHRMSYGLL
jgi:hypothetical protein